MRVVDPIVYEAQTRSLPKLHAYATNVWTKRRLIWALAQSAVKSGHLDTWFGRLWTILNPILLGLTYYLLIGVILGNDTSFEYLATLLGGLFAFYYTRTSIGAGANAIVKGGTLVRATSVPRMILPLASVATALYTYLPTLAVYAIFHLVGGLPVTPALLLLPVIIVIQSVLNFGLTLLFATSTVFFRDTASFLPYLLRIWLYLTPVLYLYSDVPARVRPFLELNPLFRLFAAWQQILFDGTVPSVENLAIGVAWAGAILFIGAYLFLTREREFVIRI